MVNQGQCCEGAYLIQISRHYHCSCWGCSSCCYYYYYYYYYLLLRLLLLLLLPPPPLLLLPLLLLLLLIFLLLLLQHLLLLLIVMKYFDLMFKSNLRSQLCQCSNILLSSGGIWVSLKPALQDGHCVFQWSGEDHGQRLSEESKSSAWPAFNWCTKSQDFCLQQLMIRLS